MREVSRSRFSLGAALVAAGIWLWAPEPSRASGGAADPGRETRETEDAKQPAAAAAGEEGFSIRSADGHFALRLRWIMQTDGRFFADDRREPAASTFLVRTARPIIEATVYRYFDFRIVPDFGNGKALVQDVYVEARLSPAVRIRAGKHKSPFGIERLQQETDLFFVERALPNNLVPNRDVGLQVHGQAAGGLLAYAAGAFNGVPDGGSADADSDDGKDVEARFFVRPFRSAGIEPLREFGIGAAATRGSPAGTPSLPALPEYKSPGQRTIFSYRFDPNAAADTAFADGTRARFSPQAFWYWKRAGLLSEYVRTAQEVRRDAATATIANRAWQVAGSFMLTDDGASYRSVSPKRPIGADGGGYGALEIAGRYSRLDIDSDAFPVFADPAKSVSAASAWGVGFNWWLNTAVKLTLDFERTRFTGGSPSGDREAEKVVTIRFQTAL